LTTIAFDGRSVAADRQMTIGGTAIKSPFPKIKRVMIEGVKSICGFSSGNVCHVMPVLEWLQQGCPDERPDISDAKDFSLILVNRAGVFYSTESLNLVPIGNIPWAIGSGADFALGAMAAGASAKRAVMLTMQLDTSTGMGFDVLPLLK